MPNRDDFFDELGRIFEESRKNNAQFVEVRSGDLHKNLGGYPGHNHQMPTCCDIMKQVMGKNDAILKQPAKGRGANLIIRYQLPRKLSKTHNSIIQIESPKNNQFPQKNTKIEKINAIIDIDSSQKSRSSGSTIKNDDNIAKKLFENRIDTLLLKSKDFAPLKEICALMEIDPISALVKIRSIAEKISRKICDNSNIDTKNLIFSQLCSKISENNLLSENGIVYLNNIRIAGNTAAHQKDNINTSDFSTSDVLIYGQAIIEVIDESLKRNLL